MKKILALSLACCLLLTGCGSRIYLNYRETEYLLLVQALGADTWEQGGVTLSVKEVTGVPVKLIGVGEGIDDLQNFAPEDFAKALFE